MKHLNFLTGLPRSGSTLLATLLNQHPKIYASPHSALIDGIFSLRDIWGNSDSVAFQLRVAAYQEALWTIPQTFYRNIEKDIIFDKNFCWSTPENLHLAQRISTNPRFLCIYRPVIEILTSYISKASENPSFYLNKLFDESQFYAKEYLCRNDAMAEYLMTIHSQLPKSILGLIHAKQQEDLGIFKFISYHDLISKPKEVMSDIYRFLNVEDVDVKITALEDVFEYKDAHRLGIPNFHKVRPEISSLSKKPNEFFTEYILNKYDNALAPAGLE